MQYQLTISYSVLPSCAQQHAPHHHHHRRTGPPHHPTDAAAAPAGVWATSGSNAANIYDIITEGMISYMISCDIELIYDIIHLSMIS
jgi:hypothetical protein